MLARVYRLISTSAVLIFITTTSSSSVLAGSSSSSSAPIFDSTRVPQLIQDYSTSLSQLPQTQDWTRFTSSPPALTTSYAWVATNNILSSYSIASGNAIGGDSSLSIQSSSLPPNAPVTSCSNPIISSTLDTENDGYQYAYLLCDSATIIRASINDDTGDMIVDYANPITVTSSVTLPAGSNPYPNQYTPKLKSPMFVVPRTNASDLLIVTGNGVLFVIDSQTGKQYCNQFGPSANALGQSFEGTLDEIQFTVTAADTTSPRIFALARDSLHNYHIVNMPLPGDGGDWDVHSTSCAGPSSTYQMSMYMRETPYSVFYFYLLPTTSSYSTTWKVQKQYKSNFLQMDSFPTITTTLISGDIKSIYESYEGVSIAIGISLGSWYRLDFSSTAYYPVSTIYSSYYTAFLLDQSGARVFQFRLGELAVIDLTTLTSYYYSNTYLTPSYLFSYIQSVPDQLYSRFPKIFSTSGSASYYVNNMVPIMGTPGSNSFIMFQSKSVAYSTNNVVAQVITTTVAPSCASLDYSSSISQTCGCGSLTGYKTARTCVWSGYSCSSSTMSYSVPNCNTPYTPPSYNRRHSKPNLRLILGLTIPLSVFFLTLFISLCIRRKRRIAADRASAAALGVAPGGVVISSVPFLSPSAPPSSSSSSSAVIGIPVAQGMVHGHPVGSMIPMAMIVSQPAYSQPYHQLPSQQQQQSMYPQV